MYTFLSKPILIRILKKKVYYSYVNNFWNILKIYTELKKVKNLGKINKKN